MGGRSFGKVTVENNVLNFTGVCRIVPSLKAPGFITAQTSDFKSWPDVSGCKGITIKAKANSDYSGYRISFGRGHPIGGKLRARAFVCSRAAASASSRCTRPAPRLPSHILRCCSPAARVSAAVTIALVEATSP
eukprot:6179041-Pleurochrysis_carterae.AAC.6